MTRLGWLICEHPFEGTLYPFAGHLKEIMTSTVSTWLFRYIRSKNRANLKYKLSPNNMADMTEKEVDLHRGLLQEKKAKKSKKFRSSTLPFNQSVMHTDLVPEQLDWRDYGTQTNIPDHFRRFFTQYSHISPRWELPYQTLVSRNAG